MRKRAVIGVVVRAACLLAVMAWGAGSALGGGDGGGDGLRVIDGMEDAPAWEVRAADGVRITTSNEDGVRGRSMRIDYDFTRGSGYGIVRRELNVPLPENYRFVWQMRGQGPSNTLEFKLVDASDENVWWVNQVNLKMPKAWTEMSLPKRRFSFAWGPSGGKPIPAARFIEVAITSYSGGKGTVWLDELAIEELEPLRAYAGTPVASDSAGAEVKVGSDGAMDWRPGDGQAAMLGVDYGSVRAFGGVVVKWEPGASPKRWVLEGGDGKAFTTLASVEDGGARVQVVSTPDRQAQVLRVRVVEGGGGGGGVRLRGLDLLAPEAADDPNAVVMRLAREVPKGWWPRAMLGQGTYWTVLGADGDASEALIGEDGELEIGKGGPSLQPFVMMGGELLSWHNTTATTQDLVDGWMPMPGVTRAYGAVTLETRALVDGPAGASELWARYIVRNTSDRRQTGRLAVALRPTQVNPPYQWLNMVGGVAPVRSLKVAGAGGVEADGRRVQAVTPAGAQAEFGISGQWSGDAVERLVSGGGLGGNGVDDPAGLASAVWTYGFDLEPGAAKTVVFRTAMQSQGNGGALGPAASAADAARAFEERMERTKAVWAGRVGGVKLELPGEFGRLVADSVRANLAYILINKDGPGIQPGSRSYERTWIRDGTLTSAAMLSFGLEDEVREFVDWFGPFQYENGKVPCCVDRRGPDPVPEHDSHGQYIHAVMRYFRHTGDVEFLKRHWPRVLKAAAYMQSLRAQRMTAEYRDGGDEKRAYYGVFPESISHEGYSAKPMHSYWDTMFGVRGMLDAAAMAGVLGDVENQRLLAAQAADFQRCMAESVALAGRLRNIEYVPGCVELGDFDATSTTVAFFPCEQADALPRAQLTATFERFWSFFQRRRDGVEKWENYTPYEHRIVGAMIELGWRERAHEVWRWYFQHQRPAGWHHWAEVVWNDPRTAKFIGDMPHSWCGSDFVNAVRLMLAFERESDGSLVLGAGVPLEWMLDPEGVRVEGLRTFYGPVSYSLRRDAADSRTVRMTIQPVRVGEAGPAGGVKVWLPEAGRLERVEVDGRVVETEGGVVRVEMTGKPVEVRARYAEVR